MVNWLKILKLLTKKTFNYFVSKLSDSFNESELNEMRSTFPKTKIDVMKKHINKWESLVSTYETIYSDDTHIKEFAIEQGVDPNQFRAYMRKHSKIEVNPLKKRITKSGEMEIKELLESGFSAGKVAEMKGVGYIAVNRIREKYGISPATRWHNTPEVQEPQKTEESSENKTWGDLPTVLENEVHQDELDSTPIQNGSNEVKLPEPSNISYVAGGKEAWNILSTQFDEVIPEDVYQNNQEFTAYVKKVSEKYHTSATQTKRFIKSRMFDKEQGDLHHGYRDLDYIIDRYKLIILKKVSEIESLPTHEQINELKDLKSDFEFMKELKNALQ
jgi:hypothetical protein